MEFLFDRTELINIRKSLRKEWLLTNGLGDYASSSLIACNTRKYHGLLVANLNGGRHVLLSAIEESVLGAGKEFFFSTRQHPNVYFPHGHEYLASVSVSDWPAFSYKIGDVTIVRELLMPRDKTQLLIKYTIHCGKNNPALTLRLKPLLAFRHFHNLTQANDALQSKTRTQGQSVVVQPYASLPELYMHVQGQSSFTAAPDWCRNVQYFIEEERGFPASEDLFAPGTFDIPIQPDKPVYISVSTFEEKQDLAAIWDEEVSHRTTLCKAADNILGHFARLGSTFMITNPKGELSVLAGYHWFDAWGRDTFIALPGLTFCAGRLTKGVRILDGVSKSIRNGIIPNCFDGSADNHAYNSVDASLWYIWAVQKLLHHLPDHIDWVKDHAWPVIKQIIDAYSGGMHPHIHMDEHGMLHTGSAQTQLTWMDATVNGQPVTPRHGCAVEINALWYNAVAFADFLAGKFNEPAYVRTTFLRNLRVAFRKRFWVDSKGGYLGDAWHDGVLDTSIRPNQIFAVSLPYPVLEDDYQAFVVECVRNKLLTPYGLRTLAPDDPRYKARYEGGPAERDGAYHQGTVWPWLLGHYTEALLRAAWDTNAAAAGLLNKVKPLFSRHLREAGIGTVSEIFSGSSPYEPNGCISQAWSISECLRLLRLLQMAAPEVYANWEASLTERA